MLRVQSRLLMRVTLSAVAIALATFTAGSAAAQNDNGTGTAPELEGTWRTTVALYNMPGGDPPPLEGVLHSFSRGGVVVVTVPLPGQSAAQGVWARVGQRRFAWTVEMYWVDPGGGPTMGRTKVKEIIELNQAGDEYRSLQSSAVDYFPDGRTLAYCARTHGKRMRVELPDPCH
jgi:hypothetical protein